MSETIALHGESAEAAEKHVAGAVQGRCKDLAKSKSQSDLPIGSKILQLHTRQSSKWARIEAKRAEREAVEGRKPVVTAAAKKDTRNPGRLVAVFRVDESGAETQVSGSISSWKIAQQMADRMNEERTQDDRADGYEYEARRVRK